MRLRGLKDLEVVLALSTSEEVRARRYLDDLSVALPNFPGLIVLSDLLLRSLRVTVEAAFGKGDDARDTFPTFAARSERQEVEHWLRRFELELHVGSLIDTERDPMPPFAIRQNDNAIRIPPWSTDEAIENNLAIRKQNVETRRLENEEFRNDQERSLRAGHPGIWTLEEIERMADTAKYSVRIRREVNLLIRRRAAEE